MTKQSDQMTLRANQEKVAPGDYMGRVRSSRFSYKAVTGTVLAQDEVLELCKVPGAARILEIRFAHSAWGTSRTLTIGREGDATRYSGALAVATAGEKACANTIALNKHDQATDAAIIATLGGGAGAVDNEIRGEVVYVVN